MDSKKEQSNGSDPIPSFKASWRIWSIFIVLCLLSFISAVDATIITTSLPTITREIGGEEKYAWIANSFVFASTVPQLLYGQIADIFGRRNPILVATCLFALGSGIAGGSRNVGMLISGRVLQGLGTAGMYVLSDIIICDMIPPRYRAPYLGAVLATAAIGTTIGPVIGGALAAVEWRWIFWLNLPISGLAIFVIVLLLNVSYPLSTTWKEALVRVDYTGNLIFIPSILSLFFGLIMGGVDYPWSSWRIILPLALGVLGCAGFLVQQSKSSNPSMPPRLFKHRTSKGGYIIIFLCAIVIQAISYFIPIYFQAVLGVSALRSGVNFLPFALAVLPFSGIAGKVLFSTGKYIPLHFAGFALVAIGCGLFSILDVSAYKAEWASFQIIAAAGVALIFTSTLPSTLAPLQEADVAVATGTYSFIRSFGMVWGVTIASIVFNGEYNAHLYLVDDSSIRATLADGAAYGLASGDFLSNLTDETRIQTIEVYTQALRVVWFVLAGISGLGFLSVFVEKHVELRKDHETEYGLRKQEVSTSV